MIHAILSLSLLASPAAGAEAPNAKTAAQPAAKPAPQTAPQAAAKAAQPAAKPAAKAAANSAASTGAKAPAEAVQPAEAQPPAAAPASQPRAEVRTDADSADDEPDYGKPSGIFGPVTIGPSFSLLGFPHPLEAALEAKWNNLIGMQVTYGFIPKISISSASAKMNSIDARARIFPFRGAFFIGAAFFGTQTVTATKTQAIQGTNVNANLELKNKYLTPQLGWRWTWRSGFFMGMEFGWQFNRGATTTLTTDAPAAIQNTQDYRNLVNDVTKTGNDLGNKGLPSMTLLHLGFLL